MDYLELPVTDEPCQVQLLPVSPDGAAFTAKVELRYLSAPDLWFLSISDAATGELLVNRIPLIASVLFPNDLFFPFRHLFLGNGIGSFFCLRGAEGTAGPNPGEENLSEFRLVWGDRYDPEGADDA